MGKPIIRFKGYEDDWEQRKLNEIADKVSEKNKNNEFSEPFTNSAEQGIISQKDFFDREIVNNENLNGYYIVRDDDFIYNPRISVTAPVGPINRNRLGRNGVMSPLYTVFRTHDIDNLYLEFYFKTTKWHHFMKLNGDSGARFDRFTISSMQFMKMPIPYPTIEEQRKIGKYFDDLDHLITLHQRKCKQTKILKKYMLQKMFPQNGEKVPEIRFAGFTDDWEQRKWIDTVDISTEMVDPTSGEYDDMPHIAPGNIESFTGRILDNVKTVKEEQLISGKFRFRPDDVVYGKINPQLGKYFYARVDGLTSADAYVFKGKNGTTQKFLFSLLQTRDFFKYSVSVSKRSGMPKINRDELNAYIFLEPSEEEQDKIGSFLLNIDYLITLHQRKCDELQKIKKFMLQNMFV